MNHLVKLTVIVGGLVLVFAVLLGTVIAEFAFGAARIDPPRPLPGKQQPRGGPGIRDPQRPNSFPPSGAADKVEWS